MVKDHDKTTSWSSGLLELNTEFVTYTMMPLCTMWESELNSKLLGDDDRYYCKFNMSGLLRGNPKDRAMAQKIYRDMGVYDIDEIRALEEMNPLPDGLGKARLIQLNMTTLDRIVNGETKGDADVKTKENREPFFPC
jgi:phage portal protein BeeE